jgi:hypothetical protein
MSIPWENIIKTYRKHLSNNKFEHLENYALDFVNFIENERTLFPESLQEHFFYGYIYSFLESIKSEINNAIKQLFGNSKKVRISEIKTAIKNTVEKRYKNWDNSKLLPSFEKANEIQLSIKFKDAIDNTIKEVLQELPLTEALKTKLKTTCTRIFSRDLFSKSNSGVVIAGFGEKDIFPAFYDLVFEVIINNKVKYKINRNKNIDYDNNSHVAAFAQAEMVHAFMEGIDPVLESVSKQTLMAIFKKYATLISKQLPIGEEERKRIEQDLDKTNKQLLDEYISSMEEFRNQNFVSPIIQVLSSLNKDELAALAESLVSLTSLKRKYTMEAETVGGPIDVAVISKGDGFIWIKRKHYFNPELNNQFFANYYR